MRSSLRFIGLISLILVVMCVGIAYFDHVECHGEHQRRHCAD